MMWGIWCSKLTDIQFNYFLNPGEWCEALITHDGSELKIYVNGQLTNSVAYTSNVNISNLILGKKIGYYDDRQWFNGNIDQVLVYDRVLSGEEVQSFFDTKDHPISGLVLDYSFHTGFGDVSFDESGSANHGNILGATWNEVVSGCTDSYANNFNSDAQVDDGNCEYPESGDFSLDFDGNVNAVNINVNTTGDYTVSGWFNYDVADDGNCIVGSNSNDYIRIVPSPDGSDQRALGYNSPTGANHRGQIILSPGTWYHFAVARLGTNLSFYINGELDQSFYEGGQLMDWVKIGLHRNGWQHGFDGRIDGISIWDRSLEQSEIQDVFSNFDFQSSEGLKAAYSFNSGSGEIAYDRSSNQKHGTISGAIWSEDVYAPPIPPIVGGNNSLIFGLMIYDGVDDLVQLNQDAFSGQTATLMAWFNPELNTNNTSDSGKPIYCQGASTTTWATFGVGLRPNSIWLEMGNNDQVELTSGSFNYNQWNHIALSFDNGLVNTFINGSLVSTIQMSSNTISNNSSGAFIGRRGNTSNVDEEKLFIPSL